MDCFYCIDIFVQVLFIRMRQTFRDHVDKAIHSCSSVGYPIITGLFFCFHETNLGKAGFSAR